MNFSKDKSLVFIPDGIDEEKGLTRTTDLCIAAHQDDIEIMAFGPTSNCYGKKDKWFSGVCVTDGAGSPRSGIYANFTDEEMKEIRVCEQKNAASVGGYASQIFLSFTSKEVKDGSNKAPVNDIAKLLLKIKPEIVYTHNLADKHDTHVAVALRTIEALRQISNQYKPQKVYSLEVWRGLDWVNDDEKVIFDTSNHPALANALLGVYDSQIAGGKRYDSAAIGRRLANATFFASHDCDEIDSMSYGLDITELVYSNITPADFINKYIESFKNDVNKRIEKLS